MENILLAIHLIIAVSLVIVILLQKSEGGALGIGGGGGSQFGIFTARGNANFLTRLTAILAVCFITTSLLLTIIHSRDKNQEEVILQELQEQTDITIPEEPSVPLSQ